MPRVAEVGEAARLAGRSASGVAMRVLDGLRDRQVRFWLLAGTVTALAILAIAGSRPTGTQSADAGKLPVPGRSGSPRSSAATDDPSSSTSGTTSGTVDNPSGRPTADLLLPNLVVLDAEELGITGRNRRVLRFATILANVGAGPLQVNPRNELLCPRGQRYVEQRVHVDRDGDGEYARDRDRRRMGLPGACMLFHSGHDHWHFDSTAAYVLTRVGDEAPIVSRDKVSFCLRDSEPFADAEIRHRRTYGECARDRRQGLTVGWADRYDSELDGQRLVLPAGLGNGRFCLRLEVDPFGLLTETREDDNTSATMIRIRGRDVQRLDGGC